jgi:K+-sensing histidine kinase KdpD
MTPEELKTKIDELRTLMKNLLSSKKIRSGGARRNAKADALEELSDHAVVMRDTLREEK